MEKKLALVEIGFIASALYAEDGIDFDTRDLVEIVDDNWEDFKKWDDEGTDFYSNIESFFKPLLKGNT